MPHMSIGEKEMERTTLTQIWNWFSFQCKVMLVVGTFGMIIPCLLADKGLLSHEIAKPLVLNTIVVCCFLMVWRIRDAIGSAIQNSRRRRIQALKVKTS